MGVIEWFLRFMFWSWFAVTGVCFVDMAMDLQKTTIEAYKKGPISASVFTHMLTDEPEKKKNK